MGKSKSARDSASIERPAVKPAGWIEMVGAIHRVMVLYLTGILLLFRNMGGDVSSGAPIPLKMLPVLGWVGFGWAGFYLVALAARGSRSGKVLDCFSIANGLALLGFLIFYVLGGLPTIMAGVA